MVDTRIQTMKGKIQKIQKTIEDFVVEELNENRREHIVIDLLKARDKLEKVEKVLSRELKKK